MKKAVSGLLLLITILLFGCASNREFRELESITDENLNGTWLIRKAELSGKNLPMPSGFELQIAGTQYRAGTPPPGDRGKLILFGDELAGEAARMDVVGEDGPNKGKRFPAIYRFKGRELEICYDLSEQDRPTEFVSREGTKVLRVTYGRK